ncbi:MAG TPA: DMT family transporter [Thermoanaerobaculaceae bacterium]|nr:DMT family transporter [Thermoanaerobaculaceae bacterium]
MPSGELAALGTATCWSFTGLFFAEAARRVGALRVNLLRLPVALALLTLALVATGGSLSTLDARRVGWLAASGIVGLVIGDLALFEAMRRIGPRLSLLIMSLAPISASVTGLLMLGERPGRMALLGIAVTLAGVTWVVGERGAGHAPGSHEAIGVVLATLGAVCQGFGLVLAKVGMAGEVPALAATWVRMCTATASIWLLTVLSGRARHVAPSEAARKAGLPILGGAVFGPFLGVWLSLLAARLTEVGVAATIMATTPVLVIPILAVSERYRPTARAVVGTLVTVVGVALLFSS